VGQKAKIAFVAAAGAAVGVVLARLRRTPEAPPPPRDERAEELRRKLAEAREAAVDEDDFEAAGMGAETLVEEPVVPEPEPPRPEPEPSTPVAEEPSAPEQRPDDEFEAMRRRIHEEGRAAAEEMRRSGEPPEQA
jgi:hypothetical protein